MQNNMFENFLLQEIMDEDINYNVIIEGVQQLVQPLVVIAPAPRVVPVRNENYYEIVIPNYNLYDFKAHFRMSRNTFQILLNQLQLIKPENVEEIIPFEKKLLFTIWILSKPESFIAAGDRFDMARSTSHNIFFEMITLITNLRQNISWPNLNERKRISQTLENKSGIPGIVGAIDGCHIAIKGPPHNAIDYYNRNNYHSVVLQAVCNDKRQFTDIFVGIPGRVHDARVFRQSPLYDMLTTDPQSISQTEHLLGDAAYPLSSFLLKPYRDNGHLRNVEIRFNKTMSAIRSLIEQAFGLLKGKFRRLKYLDMARVDMILSVITAACVLHNMIITNDGLDAEYTEQLATEDLQQNEELPSDGEENNTAERKRDYIASLLH